MISDMTPWTSRAWLADPLRFPEYVTRARMHAKCFTAEEIRAKHREWHARAAALPEVAIAGGGEDQAIESALRAGELGNAERIAKIQELWRVFTEEQKAGFKAEWNAIHRAAREADIKMLPEGNAEAPRAIRAVKGKIGVIPIWGPVDQRTSSALEKAGGTPLDYVSMALDAMLGNATIGAIVLHIDSPGGGTYGVEELSDKIFRARAQKPIYAIADSMMASAAFWIGSAATMILATPGGDVGSVGVYAMHVDESANLEKEGFKVTLVSAGEHKVEYASTNPLSEGAKKALQESVDATYGKFLGALKRNRDTSLENVRESYGKGRVLKADQALAAGMIDRVMTFEELLGKLAGGPAQKQQKGAVSALAMRMKHERAKRISA